MKAFKKIVISAGPTREKIDPVRFLSNRSSGKMGYALAENAVDFAEKVVLVSGPVSLLVPEKVECIKIESAAEMAKAMFSASRDADLIIMCAAVADYRPKFVHDTKMKKSDGDLTLVLERTEDILQTLGKNKVSGQIIAGFAAETNDILENAQSKLERKNLDFIIANDVSSSSQGGFAVDVNAVTIIDKSGHREVFELCSKKELAGKILTYIAAKTH